MSIYCGPLSAGPQRPGLCWGDLGVATVPFRSGHSRKLTGGKPDPCPPPWSQDASHAHAARARHGIGNPDQRGTARPGPR